MCVSKFKNGEGKTLYVQAVGGDQGCSACALFFTVWVRHGYNHFFGTAWEEWWSDFIDDTIVSGTDSGDSDLKLFILNAVKIKMGLHPSPKQDMSLARRRWCSRGWCGRFRVSLWVIKGGSTS